MLPQESLTDENPYAAPQAELTEFAPSYNKGRGPRLQASYLRNAIRNTFYVYLALLVTLLCIATIVGCVAREWHATLQATWAGGCLITALCWPIGIIVGCLGMIGDYLLQLLGLRQYSPDFAALPLKSDYVAQADWGNIVDGK